MVCARSYDEIPVVTPLPRASIETVNAVPRFAVLWSTMGPNSNWSSRSPVIARQIKPRAWVAIKLITSGVTISAAITRSPSFSRSSSSAMTIMRPDRNSLSEFSISVNFVAWATRQRSSPPDTREISDETSRSTALGRWLDIGAPIKANSSDRLHDRERMPHPFLLGPQVRHRIRAWRCFAGNLLDDFDSTLCQCFNFLRVVCHQADMVNPNFMQNSDCQAEIAAVSIKT